MRYIVVVVVAALCGCGPPIGTLDGQCTAASRCDDGLICADNQCAEPNCDERCVVDSQCDAHCTDLRDCCKCLFDLQCLVDGLDADRCFENIDGGGLINVSQGCATDEARCGVACGDVLSAT